MVLSEEYEKLQKQPPVVIEAEDTKSLLLEERNGAVRVRNRVRNRCGGCRNSTRWGPQWWRSRS